MAQTGRPEAYSEELANEILARMNEGRSLRSICEDEDMPCQGMVFRWLAKYQGFREKYRASAEIRADVLHEKMLDTAHATLVGEIKTTKETKDGTFEEVRCADNVERSKLIVNTLQWQIARMAPKKYGDKIEISGDKENPLAHKVTVGEELAEILTLEQLEKIRSRVLTKPNAG